MNIIIGSGPTALACAQALVSQKQKVHIMDVGLTIEKQKQQLIDRLSIHSPHEWDFADLHQIKGEQTANVKGVTHKKLFGSDFSTRSLTTASKIVMEQAVGYRSLAFGGLSNIWGSAILPFTGHDTKDWPLSIKELSPHYKRVLSLMPFSSCKDDIDPLFDFDYESHSSLNISHQAESLLNCMHQNKNSLNDQGICFGRSKLAVRVQSKNSKGCVYCGLCLYGCPYDYIFNSSSIIKKLKTEGVTYTNNIYIDSFEEINNQVKLHTMGAHNNKKETLIADRLFIACGALESTRLFLKSQNRINQPVIMKDSQYILMPIFGSSSMDGVENEKLHTLAQLFIDILDKKISDHYIHMQLYTYNELIKESIKSKLGPFNFLLRYPFQNILSRLMVIQCLFHSDDSDQMQVSLDKDNKTKELILHLTGHPSNKTKLKTKLLTKKLEGLGKYLGFKPIHFLVNRGLPGQSWHMGSTLPMTQTPTRFNDTDLCGRPLGYQRVHFVDSSVLPSIPATTITFTAMANAHRIGIESALGHL